MKRQNLNVMIIGIALVIGGILLSRNVAMSDEGSAVDFRSIAGQLTPRSDASAEGVVTYRQYRFRTTSDLFDQLANLLMTSQDVPQADVCDQVQAWLDGNLPQEREAWFGVCAFRPDQWVDQKQRITGVDTTATTTQALAAAAGMNAAPITNEVVRHLDGVVETTIEDGITVYKRSSPGMVHPLVPMDISLAPWQDAIDLGANVEGQEIHGEVDGHHHSITYVNSLADSSWVATEYAFDASLELAPRTVQSYDAEGTLMRIVFGYAPAAPGELMRPRAVARGLAREGGDIEASVWVIEDWEDSCDPSLVELREPALYLELDFMGDAGTPTATVREPDYLIEVEPCSRLQVALDNVIEAFGTDNNAADYTYDGIVNADDIDAVLARFGSSGQ